MGRQQAAQAYDSSVTERSCARLLALLVGQPDRAPSCDFRYAKAPHYVRRGDLTATRQVHLATGESRDSLALGGYDG